MCRFLTPATENVGLQTYWPRGTLDKKARRTPSSCVSKPLANVVDGPLHLTAALKDEKRNNLKVRKIWTWFEDEKSSRNTIEISSYMCFFFEKRAAESRLRFFSTAAWTAGAIRPSPGLCVQRSEDPMVHQPFKHKTNQLTNATSTSKSK